MMYMTKATGRILRHLWSRLKVSESATRLHSSRGISMPHQAMAGCRDFTYEPASCVPEYISSGAHYACTKSCPPVAPRRVAGRRRKKDNLMNCPLLSWIELFGKSRVQSC